MRAAYDAMLHSMFHMLHFVVHLKNCEHTHVASTGAQVFCRRVLESLSIS